MALNQVKLLDWRREPGKEKGMKANEVLKRYAQQDIRKSLKLQHQNKAEKKGMVINNPLLELMAEDTLSNLLRGDNIPKRLEASGVFFLDGFFYLIFDNLRRIAKIKKDLSDLQENCLFSLSREKINYAFEDITYNERKQKFYLVVEGLEHKKGIYQAQIEEYDRHFNFLESNWVNFSFESENKGFEGLEWVEKNGNEYLLALCEGNKCKGGKKGRQPGGGRIQVLEKQENSWQKTKTIKLPKTVQFKDYSAISLKNNQLAVISQDSAKLWIGTLRDKEWDFIDEGVVYVFPRNKKGKKVYCNIEGICWISPHQIIVVSDKCKASQPKRCKKKEQSVHIFDISKYTC